MKKIILNILVLIFCYIGNAQNVTIPDANFKAYLLNLPTINTNGDTEIQTSEATNFTGSIYASNKGISDLTGIEAFTSLTGLACSNNQLTSLDLSANTALTFIGCDNNLLTSLNTSGNNVLNNLSCHDNQLTSLDISTNTALTSLVCYNNLLANLNTSQNTLLTEIQSSNNAITSLDVSQNTVLTELYCQNNQLASLNTSGATALTTLYATNNLLTSLDVSSNTSLITLRGASNQLTMLNAKNGNNTNFTTNGFIATNNPNLTCIEVDDAAWSTTNWINIDVQSSFSTNCNYTQLTYVPDDNFENYLESNGLGNGIANDDYVLTSNIDTVTSLNVVGLNISDLTGIEDFIALTELYCQNNLLTTINTTNNIALETLSCSNNQITNLNFSSNTALSILVCSYNQLASLNLTNNTTLTELLCKNNLLSTLDVSASLSLTRLICNDNQLTNLAFPANGNLNELNCRVNQLTSLDVSANTGLTILFCQSNLLTSLNVKNGNNTNITGFAATGNPNLTCIEVDNAAWSTTNWINIDTQSSFSEDCNYTQLTYVPDDNFENYLESNGLGNGIANDDYVSTININGITNLNIPNLNITDLTGIEDFTALETLYCQGNQLTSLDLTLNTALTLVLCAGNQISNLNVTSNTALTELSCQSNQLTNLDVSANLALTTLSCQNNLLTNLNITTNVALVNLYCRQNQLTAIDVSTNTALTELSCQENQLSNLDVSANIALTNLKCYINQLANLDVSLNTNLIELICYSNQLTQLNVQNGNNTNFTLFSAHNNPDLTCIEVDDATWSTTNWTNIDAQSSFSEDCNYLAVADFNLDEVFTIYPNPTKNNFKIESDLAISKINIYDHLGKLLLQFNTQETYDVSSLTDGIYFIQIYSNNKKTQQKLIIK